MLTWWLSARSHMPHADARICLVSISHVKSTATMVATAGLQCLENCYTTTHDDTNAVCFQARLDAFSTL